MPPAANRLRAASVAAPAGYGFAAAKQDHVARVTVVGARKAAQVGARPGDAFAAKRDHVGRATVLGAEHGGTRVDDAGFAAAKRDHVVRASAGFAAAKQ